MIGKTIRSIPCKFQQNRWCKKFDGTLWVKILTFHWLQWDIFLLLINCTYTVKILRSILPNKVDPWNGPGIQDHGYFQESLVPFLISRFDSGQYPWLLRLPGSTLLSICNTGYPGTGTHYIFTMYSISIAQPRHIVWTMLKIYAAYRIVQTICHCCTTYMYLCWNVFC